MVGMTSLRVASGDDLSKKTVALVALVWCLYFNSMSKSGRKQEGGIVARYQSVNVFGW